MKSNKTNLSKFFPMIKTKETILEEINANDTLRTIFNNWPEKHQKEFLSICTGSKGVKKLYDCYFKEILNPEYAPERLSSLLSCILDRKVTVKYQLTNDNIRIGDEMSLVITDIAPVYTIVFLEKSPSIFKEYKDVFIHKFSTVSDTGLKINMLQNFIFIPVDIFLENLHNNGMRNKLDAWLTFLGCDEPEYISKLLETHPDFKPMYSDLYGICQNTERMMTMFFSEELKILDDNTVKYMMDQHEEEVKEQKAQIIEKDAEIAELKAKLAKYQAVTKN